MTLQIPPAAAFRLDDFPLRLTENVRYGDLDPNQHVNNATYSTYFETGRVSLIRNPAFGLMPPGQSWVLAHLSIDFKAEVHWPGTVELGLAVSRLGRASVTYEQVVFYNGACAASALAITVLVDERTRKPTPLTEDIIQRFQPWLRKNS